MNFFQKILDRFFPRPFYEERLNNHITKLTNPTPEQIEERKALKENLRQTYIELAAIHRYNTEQSKKRIATLKGPVIGLSVYDSKGKEFPLRRIQ